MSVGLARRTRRILTLPFLGHPPFVTPSLGGLSFFRLKPELRAGRVLTQRLLRFWVHAAIVGVPALAGKAFPAKETVRLRLAARKGHRPARPAGAMVSKLHEADDQKPFFQGVAAAEGGSNALKERGAREHRH